MLQKDKNWSTTICSELQTEKQENVCRPEEKFLLTVDISGHKTIL